MNELTLISSLSRLGTVWLVGGFVRDLLLKRPLSDVDLAVKGDARKLSRAFASKMRSKAFPLDEARGVVHQAFRALDRAAQKKVIHRNNAARRKSRLIKELNQALQA